VLGFHEKFLEVKRPDSQVGVLASGYAESIVDSNGVDSTVVGLVSCFKIFVLVSNLENHSMFGPHEDPLKTFVLRLVG